jgi:hypothetical protein
MNEDAVRFALSISGAQRRALMKILERLQGGFLDEADFQEQDDTGRSLSVVIARPFMITFWVDGPVDEMRIVDVEFVRE